MRSSITPWVAVLTTWCCTAAVAQEPANTGRFDLGAIEVVEVTGKHITGWFDPLTPAVGIEDMRRFDRQDVAEAVSLLPGVSVQNVGPRSERLIFVRGFNSRQVPLFIDGIPVYVPYDGNIDLSRLTTADIAEVSVTKGFTSVLFGANTLGGSINVVTRAPSEKVEIDAGATIAFEREFDQNNGNAYLNAGTNQGKWYAQFGASYYDQDWWTLPDDFRPTPNEDGGRRNNSATEDGKISFKIGFTPNATDEYALSYQNQQGEKQTPPYAGTTPGVAARFWRWPYYDKESLYFIARKGLGESHYARLRLYLDNFENSLRSFDDATYTTQNRPFAFNSEYDDYSWGTSLELGTTVFDRNELRFAVHYKIDVHREVDNDGAVEERYEDEWFSLGVEDSFKMTEAWTLLVGVSYDRLEGKQADDVNSGPGAQFELTSESAVNAQAGILHDFSDDLTGRFSVSQRSRFPTLKDRYSFRLGSAIPNPDLDTESALNFELGFDGTSQLGANTEVSWSAAIFHSAIDDAIESVTIPPTACTQPPCFQLQNIGEQTNQGFEGMISVEFGARWMLHANYTYVDKDNETSPHILPLDVPENSAMAYLRFMPTPDWEFLGTVEYGDERYSTTTGTRVADDFVIGSLKGTWRFIDHWQLEAGIRNIADELYAYEEGFYEAGRSYYTTIRWQY